MNKRINEFVRVMNDESIRMNDIEEVIVEYQKDLIEYFLDNQYNAKERRDFNKVQDVIRTEKFLYSLNKLVTTTDDTIMTDMAYVIMHSTKQHFVSEDIKLLAMEIGYKLRAPEINNIMEEGGLREAVTFLTVWGIRTYKTTPYFRIRTLVEVLDVLPQALALATENEMKPRDIKATFIRNALVISVPGSTPAEVLAAILRHKVKKDEKYKDYQARIKAFAINFVSVGKPEMVKDVLKVTCESLEKINAKAKDDSHKITIRDTYLDVRYLKTLLQMMDSRGADTKMVRDAFRTMIEFIDENRQYKSLF